VGRQLTPAEILGLKEDDIADLGLAGEHLRHREIAVVWLQGRCHTPGFDEDDRRLAEQLTHQQQENKSDQQPAGDVLQER